jgi:hypothetical protein
MPNPHPFEQMRYTTAEQVYGWSTDVLEEYLEWFGNRPQGFRPSNGDYATVATWARNELERRRKAK